MWLALAAAALAITVAGRLTRLSHLAAALLVGSAALLALGGLRDQTLVAAAWSLPLAVCLFRPARPVIVRTSAVAMAVLLPAVAGIGLLGIDLLASALPALGAIRAQLSLDADTAMVDDGGGFLRAARTTSGSS